MALARRIFAIPVAALVAFRTAVQCLSQQEVTGHALDHLAGISTVIMPSSISTRAPPTRSTDRLLWFSRVRRDCSSASSLDTEGATQRRRLNCAC